MPVLCNMYGRPGLREVYSVENQSFSLKGEGWKKGWG